MTKENAVFITKGELVEKVLGNGTPMKAQFVSILTQTSPKMLKTSRVSGLPNPFLNSKVLRVALRHGNLGVSYENAVNNQRKREGHPEEFKAEAMWKGAGEYLGGSKVVVRHQKTGKVYCAFYPKQNAQGTMAISEDIWLVDGTRVEKEVLQEFLPVSENPKQELKRPVPWRVIDLENIREITISGDTLKVF